MFAKKTAPQAQPVDASHSFFGKYYGIANLYTVIEGKREQRVAKGRVSFLTEKKNFDFKISVNSRDPAKPNDKFFFPINGDMKMICQVSKESRTVSYLWAADAAMKLEVEFEITDEDYDDAIKFRNVVIRLIYQVIHKKPYTELKEASEFDQYCPLKDGSDSKTPAEVVATFQQLIVSPDVEFASVGQMLSLDPNQPNQEPFMIDPHFIFLIRGLGNFTYEIQIYDKHAAHVYKRVIDPDLKFHINTETNAINWMDVKGAHSVYLSFKFRDDASKNLSVIMSMSLMQYMQKKAFDEIAKDDWHQYYGSPTTAAEDEPVNQPEYREYADARMDMEFTKSSTFVEPKYNPNSRASDLAQGKTIDRTFIAHDNNISVYQARNEDDQFEFICNLPVVKTLGGQDLNPRRVMLTEQDTKAVLLNKEEKDNTIYYMDLEKGKVVSELKGANINAVCDVSTYEKDSDLTTNSLLFGCSEKNLFQLDPRVANPVVAERPYTSNYMFGKITGAKDGSFVVGSQDGALRMYNKCAGNAKNLLPSLLGEAILHIDVSKDSRFILATCRSHIMLIPTFQEGKSGFDTTFKKDNKPKPIILKVNPRALAKFGVKEVNYSQALFDKKTQNETMIAAVAGSLLIVWELSAALNGKTDTNKVQNLGDNIVRNQFKYNTDKFIAALPNKLVCQPVNSKKR